MKLEIQFTFKITFNIFNDIISMKIKTRNFQNCLDRGARKQRCEYEMPNQLRDKNAFIL